MKVMVAVRIEIAGTVEIDVNDEGVPSPAEDSFHLDILGVNITNPVTSYSLVAPTTTPLLDKQSIEKLRERKDRIGHIVAFHILDETAQQYRRAMEKEGAELDTHQPTQIEATA